MDWLMRANCFRSAFLKRRINTTLPCPVPTWARNRLKLLRKSWANFLLHRSTEQSSAAKVSLDELDQFARLALQEFAKAALSESCTKIFSLRMYGRKTF